MRDPAEPQAAAARRAGEQLVISRVSLGRVARHEAWFTGRYLHPAERARAATLTVNKRRLDFVAGRVAAKRALGLVAPTEVEVIADVAPREGAPLALGKDGLPLGGTISISHGAGWACAASTSSGRVGIDLERIEPRHPAFLEEAFAPGELDRWRAALAIPRISDHTVTLAWCVKEAVLKLRGAGLRSALSSCGLRSIEWSDSPLAEAPRRFGVDQLCWAQVSIDGATSESRSQLGLWSDGSAMLAVLLEPDELPPEIPSGLSARRD